MPSIPTTSNPFFTTQPLRQVNQDPGSRTTQPLRQVNQDPGSRTLTIHRATLPSSPTDDTFQDTPGHDSQRASQPTSISQISTSTSHSPKPPGENSFSPRPPSPPILTSQFQPHLPGSETAITGSDFSGKPLARNVQRLEQARLADSALLGEFNIKQFQAPSYPYSKLYLPNEVSKIFPSRLSPPPLRPKTHPLDLSVILRIFDRVEPTPEDSPFRHSIDSECAVENAEYNSRLIAKFDMDMQKLLDHYPNSVITPGSEFRPATALESLLAGHPYWPRFRSIITRGVEYPLTAEEFDPARRAENDAILLYGNHASGKKNPQAIGKVIHKDAHHGFSLPITFDCARNIRHSRISPMGVAHQLGINAQGELVPKDRLTHNQSFSLGFCPSTNELIDQTQLIDLVMGHCLDRIFHQIVALR